MAYAVLKHIYGVPVPVKYGESQGILSKALNKSNLSAAVIGFNASYSDSGLTGFYLIASPQDAAAVSIARVQISIFYDGRLHRHLCTGIENRIC